MKKLIVKAEALLPEDDFAVAKFLAAMEPAIERFRKDFGMPVETAIVSVRGPNKKPAPANGPADLSLPIGGLAIS